MAARRKRSVPPEIPESSKGYDELNLGRLALISAQKTVPKTLQRWQKSIVTPDGRPIVITCAAVDDQVVPHGVDNDFMVGLINLCFEAGLPDGPFTVSAYGLLKASGFPDTVQYYQSLEASLIRLNKANYTIDEGWYTQGGQRWTTQSFAQISYLAYTHSKHGIQGTNLITVQLAPPIMESIRAGYIKPLDLNFYRSLSQPLVRAVYRQLDALHFDENTSNGLVEELVLPLMAWGNRIGIISDRPDNVERTLAPAHRELQEKGYIVQAELTGRGKGKMVRYVFTPPGQPTFPALTALLIERGVKSGVADRLSTVFPERIEEAARRFDHYIKTSQRPVGNPGGLLVSMIQRPEDFAEIPGYSGATTANSKVQKNVTVRSQAAVDEELAAIEAKEEAKVSALDGQELADWVYRQLTIMGVLKQLSPVEKSLLTDALQSGSLDGRMVVKEATRALAAGKVAMEEMVAELQKHLSHVDP